jgi:hypothetical protein
MRWIPRVRLLLARRPWLYWLLVACCSIGIGAVMTTAMGNLRREREAWGQSTRVLVATRTVAAGDTVAGSFEWRELPLTMVPPSALTSMPNAASATQRIAVGEVVVDTDIASARAPLALLPDGWLAISIPMAASDRESGGSLFVAGDVAAVLAGGEIIAEDATVVAVAADAVVVGVPRSVAGAVAQAANQLAAVVALGNP